MPANIRCGLMGKDELSYSEANWEEWRLELDASME